MISENNYILYRKIKGWLGSILFIVFRVFSINNNRICITTFEGKGGFNCNPKYIVKELHSRSNGYEFIWLVDDITKAFPEYITKKKNTLWYRAFYLSTSKIWIDNYRKPLEVRKRKGQVYINTWHGNVGFKAIGLWRGGAFSKIAYLVSKHDSDMIDYMISSSDWTTEAFVKGMVYDGIFLKYGQAREDVLINDRDAMKTHVKELFDIPHDNHIVLYAPTYREKNQQTTRKVLTEDTSLDKVGLLKQLQAQFGGEWIMFQRLHPQLAAQQENMEGADNKQIIDVSQYDDMYELLAASDAVVTDFSSIAFEAGAIKLPVFLYMDDLDEYICSRGGMNFIISQDKKITTNQDIAPNINAYPPFPIATNNKELGDIINSFDEQGYCEKIDKMCSALGMINDGKASRRVADLIANEIIN